MTLLDVVARALDPTPFEPSLIDNPGADPWRRRVREKAAEIIEAIRKHEGGGQ